MSPQDAEQLSDLKAFTRDLMAQAERDLGAKLDWLGVDHWNTDNPHIHVIVRGKGDDGRDLVIARDYISQGMRARAAHLATFELGPRSDLEIVATSTPRSRPIVGPSSIARLPARLRSMMVLSTFGLVPTREQRDLLAPF